MEWRTCVVLFCVTAVLANDEWRTVEIVEQGTVRGRKHPSGDLYAFYNIPYATAPVGVDRFKAPLSPPSWAEPFDAIDGKNIICPQATEYIQLWPSASVEVKEDCLIANVFVPTTNKANLSVLVYVHGGGFVGGYGNMYPGTQFMKKNDFIMVTFNYRLSIHGFLCLGTEDVPGNAGMKDQVALLRWVQKNIASFGGNPDDVTLAGYSAGSASVELIMLSKSARGLFHRVIPESGGSLAAFSVQRDPLEIAKTHARSLNFNNVDDINALELFYRTASIEVLTADPFADRPDSTYMFSPCVERDTGDEPFLTESPRSIIEKGEYKKLPMLYGFANMEGLLRIFVFESWKNRMNEKFSDFLPANLKFESDEEREEVADNIKKFYFGDNPVSNENILKYIDYFSAIIIYPKLWALKLHAEGGHNQIYLYEYSFVDDDTPLVPYTDVRGATHCAQTLAVLDGVDESKETPEYQNMRRIIREIWHNFIKTGTPVPPGSSLPAWPAAGAQRSPHMVLEDPLTLGGALLEDITRFWDDIYEKYHWDSVPPPKPGNASRAVQQTIFNLFLFYSLYCIVKRIIIG